LSIFLECDRWLIATHFHPIGARQVFPCWDEPKFQATFNISIKHFSHYMVLSNMPIQNRTTNTDTYMTWTYFHQTPVMPTYLVAIMLSEFPRTPFKEINFRYHTLQSKLYAEFAKKVIEDVTPYFEHEWLNLKKLPKVDHVAIPTYLHDGMDNLGLVFYR